MSKCRVKCPYCGSDKVRYNGRHKTGVQRVMCCNEECKHRTFQLEYKNKACKPGEREKIIEMAMNGAGVRDTGRILGISVSTVIKVLKKLKMASNKLTKTI